MKDNKTHNDLFKKNNLIVYVVRYSKSGIIGDSAPCYDCYNKMCELGVKTLVFSSGEGTNGSGEFTKMRFRDYTPREKTLGRYYIEFGFKQVHRIQGTNKIEDDFGNTIVDNYLLNEPNTKNIIERKNTKSKKNKLWDKQFNKLKLNKKRRKSNDSDYSNNKESNSSSHSSSSISSNKS